MKTNTAVLLAGGESSRFWPLASDKHKSMYELLGKPVLFYTLMGLKKCEITNVIIVKSPGDNSIQNYFGDGNEIGLSIKYVVQKEALGMGNAISLTREHINDDYFFVLNADQANCSDLIPEIIKKAGSQYEIMLSSQETETPWNYGILEVDGSTVKSIVEKPEKGSEPSNLMVIGLYMLSKSFFEVLDSVEQTHYNYEEAIQKYIDTKGKVGVKVFENLPEITLKFSWHLFDMYKYLFDKHINGQNIDPDAKIADSAIISGDVVIEKDVRIFENAVIKGPAYIREGAIVGNGALIREYSYIGKGSIVGYDTEIKHSILFDKVETHKNFIGDSIVDDGSGFGAGTITANRRLDRRNIKSFIKGKQVDVGSSFFGNVIGKNVHTGVLCGLMPGVKIGCNSNIAANLAIMKDVPDNTLVFRKEEHLHKKQK